MNNMLLPDLAVRVPSRVSRFQLKSVLILFVPTGLSAREEVILPKGHRDACLGSRLFTFRTYEVKWFLIIEHPRVVSA